MHTAALRRERLRAHRLTAPAASVAEAAAHLTATQAQEFWGGRWALAVRTRGESTLRDVDDAFADGILVRSWTQRGTLHILPARDLPWILSITAERQGRQLGPVHRRLGIDDDVARRAERAVRAALAGGNRLTRAEFSGVLAAVGIEPAGTRGNHLLTRLALRGVVVLGPVVPREAGPTRDQYVVAADEWIRDAVAPAEPVAELLVRYLRGHAPASLADFAWWAALPKGVAEAALAAAGDRIVEVGDGWYAVAEPPPRRSRTPTMWALPPFEEYYLSYVDRTVPCAPAFTAAIGPSINGVVRPVLVADGEIVGVWSHSLAVGRHHLAPVPELFSGDEAAASAALARFSRFLAG